MNMQPTESIILGHLEDTRERHLREARDLLSLRSNHASPNPCTLRTHKLYTRQDNRRNAPAKAEPNIKKTNTTSRAPTGQSHTPVPSQQRATQTRIERQNCVSSRNGPIDRIGEWYTTKCHSGSAFPKHWHTTLEELCVLNTVTSGSESTQPRRKF